MNVVFECVSFDAEYVRSLSKELFVEQFMDVFWLDRAEADRRTMLEDAYDTISKGAGQ